MITFKKTLTIFLLVSIAALAGCSDDGDKKNNANNANNVNNVNNVNNDAADTDNVEPDADETESDADETESDADETEPDADETEPDADETEPDADETEPDADEVDGTLLLKDLTTEQVNILCAYKFEHMEPTYDPAVPAGEGNCRNWAFWDALVEEPADQVLMCEMVEEDCMNRDYNREEEVTDGCMDEAVRAECDLTVEEYKTCAADRAAASIAHNILLLEKTCADLSTAAGRRAVENLLMEYEGPESCKNLDEKCFYID